MWEGPVPDSSPLHLFRRLIVGVVLTALMVAYWHFRSIRWRKLMQTATPVRGDFLLDNGLQRPAVLV